MVERNRRWFRVCLTVVILSVWCSSLSWRVNAQQMSDPYRFFSWPPGSPVPLLAFPESPYRFYTFIVTYGTRTILGVSQKVILINNQFPGPQIDAVTNDNILVNVINNLDEPFLLTWNGDYQKRTSWQDGVLGTNCPIPPNGNFTYKFQTKDQIGTFNYFPSTALHRAAGGYGGLNIYPRYGIPEPYPTPAADFILLIGDWFTTDHKNLRKLLDQGQDLPHPNGLVINGQQTETNFTANPGKTYKLRVSNMGLSTTFNFRIQSHKLKVVEVEGANVQQVVYDSIDVHVGQSVSVLVTLDQAPKDYYIVASSRFTKPELIATAVLRYSDSMKQISGPFHVSGPLPPPPAGQLHWSMQQARTFKWNLESNAARPEPQGSYPYGKIPVTRSFVFANSAEVINGKKRYAVNGVSFVQPDTPLKLADYFNISGVYDLNSIPTNPSDSTPARLGTPVVGFSFHEFVEIVFQNDEKTIQSWHLDGYNFWVVAFGAGKWTPSKRNTYNLVDAVVRHTTQVYPNSWTAILVSLDNLGMWNLRSANWARVYLGQQLYLRVKDTVTNPSNENKIPPNVILCGKAALLGS